MALLTCGAYIFEPQLPFSQVPPKTYMVFKVSGNKAVKKVAIYKNGPKSFSVFTSNGKDLKSVPFKLNLKDKKYVFQAENQQRVPFEAKVLDFFLRLNQHLEREAELPTYNTRLALKYKALLSKKLAFNIPLLQTKYSEFKINSYTLAALYLGRTGDLADFLEFKALMQSLPFKKTRGTKLKVGKSKKFKLGNGQYLLDTNFSQEDNRLVFSTEAYQGTNWVLLIVADLSHTQIKVPAVHDALVQSMHMRSSIKINSVRISTESGRSQYLIEHTEGPRIVFEKVLSTNQSRHKIVRFAIYKAFFDLNRPYFERLLRLNGFE